MITNEKEAIASPPDDLSQLSAGDLSRFWAVHIIRDDEFDTEIERRFGVQVPVRRAQ